MYILLHCHHQNESCIKTGSDESHFTVLLFVRDKITRQCLQATTLFRGRESLSGIEPRRLRLGQTGSRLMAEHALILRVFS